MATTDRRDGYTSYNAYPMSRPWECYNYLQPASEWKEEDGALVLLVQLPSVRHEQFAVVIESKNEIRVCGEYSPAGENRTVRFNSVYGSIPENFSVSELTVDLTLRIRIPKIITAAQTGPIEPRATTSQEAAILQENKDEQEGQKNEETANIADDKETTAVVGSDSVQPEASKNEEHLEEKRQLQPRGPTESPATTSQEASSLQETKDEQKGQKNEETANIADDKEITAGLGSDSVQPEANKNEEHLEGKRWLQPEPESEDIKWAWKEEESSFFLLINLSNFQEDKVKIIPLPSSHAIKVLAERPLASNRRSWINQDFPVPENCDMNKMQARFQAGFFIIELPKTTTKQPCPEATDEAPIPPNLAASSSVGEEKGLSNSREGIEEAASREPSRVQSFKMERKPLSRKIHRLRKKVIDEESEVKDSEALSPLKDASRPIAQKGEDEAP